MKLGEKLYFLFTELEKRGWEEAFENLVILKAIDYLVDNMSEDYKKYLREAIEKTKEEILDKEADL